MAPVRGPKCGRSTGRTKGSKMKTSLRQQLLASTLWSALLLSARLQWRRIRRPCERLRPPHGPSKAQPTPSVSAVGEDVHTGGDIIVTGSRIPQPNLESAAPVTVVSDRTSGSPVSTRGRRVNRFRRRCRSGMGVSNGATGTAEVDLRYLGAKRSAGSRQRSPLMPGDRTARPSLPI